MNKSNSSIRLFTKDQLRGNYWEAIVATIVPGIIFWIISWILLSIVGESIVLNMIISFVISVLSSFMVNKMSLNIAKNHRSAGFGESLSPSDRLLTVGLYVLIITLITMAVQMPINKVFFDTWIVTEDSINSSIANLSTGDISELYSVLLGYVGTSVLIAGLMLFITYKLIYTPFIIIDQGLDIKEAVSLSFKYTKGNFWRIIGMNLFFIGWYLLSILTCGILLFYVVPYATISATNLYLEIKEENGTPMGRVSSGGQTTKDLLEKEDEIRDANWTLMD